MANTDINKMITDNGQVISDNSNGRYNKFGDTFSFYPNEYFVRITNFKRNMEALRKAKAEAITKHFENISYIPDKTEQLVKKYISNNMLQFTGPGTDYSFSSTYYRAEGETVASAPSKGDLLEKGIEITKDNLSEQAPIANANDGEFRNDSTSLKFVSDESLKAIAKDFFNDCIKIASNKVADYATGKVTGLASSVIKTADDIIGSVKGYVNYGITHALETKYKNSWWNPVAFNRRVDNATADFIHWIRHSHARFAADNVKEWCDSKRDNLDNQRVKTDDTKVERYKTLRDLIDIIKDPDLTYLQVKDNNEHPSMLAAGPHSSQHKSETEESDWVDKFYKKTYARKGYGKAPSYDQDGNLVIDNVEEALKDALSLIKESRKRKPDENVKVKDPKDVNRLLVDEWQKDNKVKYSSKEERNRANVDINGNIDVLKADVNSIFKASDQQKVDRIRATEKNVNYLGKKQEDRMDDVTDNNTPEDSLTKSFSAHNNDTGYEDFDSINWQTKAAESEILQYLKEAREVIADTSYGKTEEERGHIVKALNDGIKTIVSRAVSASFNDIVNDIVKSRTKGEKIAESAVNGGTYSAPPLESASGAKQISSKTVGSLEDGLVYEEEPVEIAGEIEELNGEKVLVNPAASIRRWESASNKPDMTLSMARATLSELFASTKVVNEKIASIFADSQKLVEDNYLEDPRDVTYGTEEAVKALVLTRIKAALTYQEGMGISYYSEGDVAPNIVKGILSKEELATWKKWVEQWSISEQEKTGRKSIGDTTTEFSKADVDNFINAVRILQYAELAEFNYTPKNMTSDDLKKEIIDQTKRLKDFIRSAKEAYMAISFISKEFEAKPMFEYDEEGFIPIEKIREIIGNSRKSIDADAKTKNISKIDERFKVRVGDIEELVRHGMFWTRLVNNEMLINDKTDFFRQAQWKNMTESIKTFDGEPTLDDDAKSGLANYFKDLFEKYRSTVDILSDVIDGVNVGWEKAITYNEKTKSRTEEIEAVIGLIDAYEGRWDILNTATSLFRETSLGQDVFNRLEKGKRILSGAVISGMNKLTSWATDQLFGNSTRPNPAPKQLGYPKRPKDANALGNNYERDADGNVIFEPVENLTAYDDTRKYSKISAVNEDFYEYCRVSTDGNKKLVRKYLFRESALMGDFDFSKEAVAGLAIGVKCIRLVDDAFKYAYKTKLSERTAAKNNSDNFQKEFNKSLPSLFDMAENAKSLGQLSDVNCRNGFFDVTTKYRVNKTFLGTEIEHFKSGYYHFFFVKPDLNLSENHIHVMDYGNNPTLCHALPELCYDTKYLDPSWSGGGPWHMDEVLFNYRTSCMNPYFSPLISNAIKGLNIPDYTLETREGYENMFGHKVTFGTTGRRSGYGTDLSISFYDTKELLLMNIMQIWVKYIEVMYEGQAGVRCIPRQAGNLDYLGALYYFVLEPDGQSISHWGRYTGIYPTSVPWSSIQMRNNSVEIPEFSVNFKCQWHEWNNVAVLNDFNYLMRGGPWHFNSSTKTGQNNVTTLDYKSYFQMSEIYHTDGLYNYADTNLLAGGLVSENRALVEFVNLMPGESTSNRRTPHRMPFKFILHFTSSTNTDIGADVGSKVETWATDGGYTKENGTYDNMLESANTPIAPISIDKEKLKQEKDKSNAGIPNVTGASSAASKAAAMGGGH